jgi:hypothetical protein
VRWLEVEETHHPGFDGQYESLISFQPMSLDHFTNLGFMSLEGQTKFLVSTKSRVTRSREGDPDHWIQAIGEPLDQNLHVVSRIRGSRFERVSFLLQKL